MRTLGVDLGGTNLRAAVVAPDGTLDEVRKVKLVDRAPEGVIATLKTLVDEILAAENLDPGEIGAAGMGVAGQVFTATGEVLVGPNLGWHDVPFGQMLADALPFPTVVLNDLAAAVWGERIAGAGEGSGNVLMIAVGSGVGSGFVVEGVLVDGAVGVAGEFGHTKVVPDGRRCACGELGCLEAYTGGHAMADRALELIAEQGGGERILAHAAGAPLTLEHLEAAWREGDAIAQKVVSDAAGFLGLAAANLVTVLNPSHLILGGGVLLGFPAIRDGLVDGVRRYGARGAVRELVIRRAALGDDAGLIGAGLLAREVALPTVAP